MNQNPFFINLKMQKVKKFKNIFNYQKINQIEFINQKMNLVVLHKQCKSNNINVKNKKNN